MLLEDLINTKVKDINLKKPFKKYDNIDLDDEDEKIIGRGTASIVNHDATDPHMVKKSNTGNRKNDGFQKYAEFIVNNKIAEENSYFPRIYVMKNFIDSEGTQRQNYKMEKLIPYNQIDIDQLKNYYNKLFDNSHDLSVNDATNPRMVQRYITYSIEEAISGNVDPIIDEQLINAIKWLKRFEHHYAMRVSDTGNDNVMYRRTNLGIQLVFSDPVY